MKFSCADMAWALTFGVGCGLAIGLAISSAAAPRLSPGTPTSLEPRPAMPDPLLELEETRER